MRTEHGSRAQRSTATALVLSLGSVLLAAAPAAALPGPEDDVALQILGINDFHGRIEANPGSREAGAAVLAGAVAQLRAETPNTLFVSSGDNIGASTFTSFSQQDTPTIDSLNAAGLDVSAVGNHEFDRGFPDLRDRVIPDSNFPYLGANVYGRGTTTPALPEAWVTTVGGIRVGFIGVVTETTSSLVTPAGIADLEFGDELEAANRVATRLTDGDTQNEEADVVVLLLHEGAASSSCATIASTQDTFGRIVTGASAAIDAIFTGHTHLAYSCALPVGTTGSTRPVVQTGQYGGALGRVQLTVDPTTLQVTSATSDLLPLLDTPPVTTPPTPPTPLYPAVPAVADIVAEAKVEADAVGGVQVGAVTADITRALGADGKEDRGAESSLGNLVADMQLWATSNPGFAGTPAQIAFMNPGGLRADLRYGTTGAVTLRDAASVQPFANTLVTMDLTGAQLKAVLEEQWQPAGASRPKLHLGVSEGFTYTYDPAAPRGAHILSMALDGAPIVPTATYRVVVNSFLASGGDNFATLAKGINRTDTGQVDLGASVAYFVAAQGAPVAPPALGRAVVGTTPVVTPPPVVAAPVAAPTRPAATSRSTGRAALADSGPADVATALGLSALLVVAGAAMVGAARPRAAGVVTRTAATTGARRRR